MGLQDYSSVSSSRTYTLTPCNYFKNETVALVGSESFEGRPNLFQEWNIEVE